MTPRTILIPVAVALMSWGCQGMQSALAPAGEASQRIAVLFWWMAAGAVVIWIAVVALGVLYGRPHAEAPSQTRSRWLIIGSGVVFPITVLTALLAWGLSELPPLVARAPEGSLTISVIGERWWWRVRYHLPDGRAVDLANEVRLPVGEHAQFRLASDNVIHSFWIPSLAGKMDMIPGRITYLAVRPTETGIFAGACAEYCGTAHGFMRFMVRVVERSEFDRWIRQQAAAAQDPVTAEAARGRQVLLRNGCGACHTVRGTPARGAIGPDLTHVGSRLSLAAGTLDNDPTAFSHWVARPDQAKPGALMPPYWMIGEADLAALAVYLESLE
jgi:cytochrome c oxidase subunit 2